MAVLQEAGGSLFVVAEYRLQGELRPHHSTCRRGGVGPGP